MAYKQKWKSYPFPASVRFGDTLVPQAVELDAEGDGGAPNVHARFEVRDGVPEVVDFRLTASETGRGVRSADLRTLGNVEAMAFNAFHMFGRLITEDHESGETLGASLPKTKTEAWKTRRDIEEAQARKRGPSDDELQAIAEVYRKALDGNPKQAVQFYLGVSPATASRRIRLARDKGLLSETTMGRKAD